MEIEVGEYGRYMFEHMVGRQGRQAPLDHWESIRAEAEPLVRQLIALSEKMYCRPGTDPYFVTGVYVPGREGSVKRTLSKAERIRTAQVKLWGVRPQDLEVGDLVWINDNEGQDMQVGHSDPCEVEDVSEKAVYVTLDEYRNEVYRIDRTDMDRETSKWLLRAPDDYNDPANKVTVERWGHKFLENKYNFEEYWLRKADELGI